jgi:hypothetical protein
VISAQDLLDPVGPIQPGLFPKDTPQALSTRLDGYIAIGMGLTTALTTTRDRACYFYALYRAWDAVYSMLIARPSEIRQDGDSTTKYSDAQLRAAQAARDDALAQYNGLLTALPVDVELLPSSQFTHNIYTF